MTRAEALAVGLRPVHRGKVVATRHFAARRGASLRGRLLGPWITSGISRELAASEFISEHLDHRPAAVVRLPVAPSPCLWRGDSRVVLVVQRLEREKDTLTALRAWHASKLVDQGWTLRIVGDGSQRPALERWAASQSVAGVTFVGWVHDVAVELRNAGILLAPTRTEGLGLAVLEAMAAGIPVVAAAAGGHLETAGRVVYAPLFAPGDYGAAALGLQSLMPEARRARLSAEGRRVIDESFSVERHVDALISEYQRIGSDALRQPAAAADVGL